VFSANAAICQTRRAHHGHDRILIESQPIAVSEPGTLTWFAIRLDNQTFGIFDTFEDDAGRQAHLSGAIAAALMSRADELFAGPPAIRTGEVLAFKPRCVAVD
jgi:quinol monooxygenase YgiN